MVRSGKHGAVRPPGTATSSRDRDIYQRYATGLYRQAFLTLGDSALAEHVVRDVIVDECALAPAPGYGEGDAPGRLAESVFRRCQQLAADPAWRHRLPAPRLPADVAGGVDPGGLLSAKERGALGLVVIGGLGYVRVTWRPSCGRHCSGWEPRRPPRKPRNERHLGRGSRTRAGAGGK
jgi:hypothetical protein